MMRRFTRDSFVKSVKLPEKYEITLIKHFQQMDTLGAVAAIADEEVRHLLYLAKRSAPILNQDWSHIGAYQYSKASRHCLTYDEHRIISRTYSVMYPDLSEAVIPESCRKCTAVSLGNEVYGSWDSRHKRSSFVMAYWHTKDGEIITETGTGDLTPGIIQTYYLHNLLVRGDNNIHLFARVKWLRALPARYRYHCGRPVEVWSQEMFEPFGPSAFIPVARIYCKFVRADAIDTVSPIGMIKSEIFPYGTSGREWFVTVTWEPMINQIGTHLFCYTAVDNLGQTSDQTCATLVVDGEVADDVSTDTPEPDNLIVLNPECNAFKTPKKVHTKCIEATTGDPKLFYLATSCSSNFVQCTELGTGYIMRCAPGTEWCQHFLTCVHVGSCKTEG
ncbi:unnamed protein product [Mytilus edulis]|uniref:Chitin-binding type-2 domain-containing protein n=1 Tax=Mytilus edulis TaxID=6550 RepID=A0A8S3RA97_MYTED|nr:unnamed protein product [Mytilus edulis]